MSFYWGFVVYSELQTLGVVRDPSTTFKRQAINIFEGRRLYALFEPREREREREREVISELRDFECTILHLLPAIIFLAKQYLINIINSEI
jgi:hypothetical protein